MDKKQLILDGKAILGIEFGSTRIKGVLIDDCGEVLATGAFDWENSLVDGIFDTGQQTAHVDGNGRGQIHVFGLAFGGDGDLVEAEGEGAQQRVAGKHKETDYPEGYEQPAPDIFPGAVGHKLFLHGWSS